MRFQHAATIIVLLFCSWAMAEKEHDEAFKEAQRILTKFKVNLRSVQIDGFAAKKPGICSARAQKVATDSVEKGVMVGRTSHKLRNPKNTPKPWMISILNEFKDSRVDKPAKPKMIKVSDSVIGYAEPIYAEDLCLICHGKKISPSIHKELKLSYPDDQATGFEYGEFRGIYWIEMPCSEKTKNP